MHRQRTLLMQDAHPYFFIGKERERVGLQKKLSFKKKIIHFLHFKTFSSIIVFMWCNAF